MESMLQQTTLISVIKRDKFADGKEGTMDKSLTGNSSLSYINNVIITILSLL